MFLAQIVWGERPCLLVRDRPKPNLLVSAVAETVAETRDTYTAITEP